MMRDFYYTIGGQGPFAAFVTFPAKVIIGTGEARQKLGAEAKSLGAKKALMITGQVITKIGWVDLIKESLQSEKIHFDVFNEVQPEPPASQGDECGELARKGRYDLIIGLGGGSSMDIAKATSIMAKNEGKLLDYSLAPWTVPRKGIPLILIPTTSGSGSEMSPGIAVTDDTGRSKRLIISQYTHPDVVIVDPLLTVSMPREMTAGTGIDALSNAIESYVAIIRHPFTDVLAIEVIRLIAKYLPVAFAKGNNLEARFHMSLAATMAGICLYRSTSVHGLATLISLKYQIPHGRSVAIMLPYVMAQSIAGNPDKYARIALAMGENVEGLSTYDAAMKSVTAVRRLNEMLEISIKLTDYGASINDLEELVEQSMKLPQRITENDPKDLTRENFMNIFRQALQS